MQNGALVCLAVALCVFSSKLSEAHDTDLTKLSLPPR
jgi:hypothetical protein